MPQLRTPSSVALMHCPEAYIGITRVPPRGKMQKDLASGLCSQGANSRKGSIVVTQEGTSDYVSMRVQDTLKQARKTGVLNWGAREPTSKGLASWLRQT